MTIKTIYVNPGDVVIVRTMADPELPKNNNEWVMENSRHRADSFMFTVNGLSSIKFDTGFRPDVEFWSGTKHVKNV